MFEKLISIWKKDSLVATAYQDTTEMLKLAETQFQAVSDQFLYQKKIEFDVYAKDEKINSFEIEIRRKVLEHLTVNPKQDTVASLVLTSIIVDIERIGDYIKNIFELHEIIQCEAFQEKYAAHLRQATKNISEMFALSTVAFVEEDKEKAEKVLVLYQVVKNECRATIRDVAADETLRAKEAVTYGLYARFLRRISAHMANIATTVLNPYDKIRYNKGRDID